jgi:hypothetical protein
MFSLHGFLYQEKLLIESMVETLSADDPHSVENVNYKKLNRCYYGISNGRCEK